MKQMGLDWILIETNSDRFTTHRIITAPVIDLVMNGSYCLAYLVIICQLLSRAIGASPILSFTN